MELNRLNIPYIIIPRGSLTTSAQSIKPIKKKIGNILCFNSFVKKSVAIQYLTLDEYKTSGDIWNKKSLIIPNSKNSLLFFKP